MASVPDTRHDPDLLIRIPVTVYDHCKQVITAWKREADGRPVIRGGGDQGIVRSTRRHYGSFVRTNLAIGDLGGLLAFGDDMQESLCGWHVVGSPGVTASQV
jgi:hypothetical protein